MVSVSSVNKSPLGRREQLINKFAGSKMLQRLGRAYTKNPVGVAAGIALTSIVSKDTLACYLYVRQSLNNKKIPEEKRGFVAALDLANGVLMIGTQLLAFFTVSNDKVQKKLFNSTVGKMFGYMNKKAARHSSKKNEFLKNQDREVILKGLKDYENVCRAGFKFVLPLVASTIIAKRMIVPFIATPAASWVKKNILHDETGEEQTKQTQTQNQNQNQNQNIPMTQKTQILSGNNNLRSQFEKISRISTSA